MPEIKVIEDKPISMAELKEELKEIKKRDAELGFRTAKVAEQLDLLKIVKQKEAEEMFEKIQKLAVSRLKDMHILKIIDLMPLNITELKNVTKSYSLTVNNESLEKILEILSEYQSKKK